MRPTRHTTRRTEDCRWSVPSLRRKLMSEGDDDFEFFWTCERTGAAVAVDADRCAQCPYWSPEDRRPEGGHRRR